MYFLLYAIGRFLIEFLRNDPRGNVGMLSTSQFIAIFMAVAAILLLVFSAKFEEKAVKRVEETIVSEESDEK